MKISDITPGPYFDTTFSRIVIVPEGGKLYHRCDDPNAVLSPAPSKRYGATAGLLTLSSPSYLSTEALERHDTFFELVSASPQIVALALENSRAAAETEASRILGAPVRLNTRTNPANLVPLDEEVVTWHRKALEASDVLGSLRVRHQLDDTENCGFTNVVLRLTPEQAMICARTLEAHASEN